MSNSYTQKVITIENLLQNQDYENLQAFIEQEFEHGILSSEAVNTARELRLSTSVIYLTSLCIENLPQPAPFRKWLALYRTMAQRRPTAEFENIGGKSPLKVVALIAIGQATPERLIGCHKKMSEWIEAVELAIDQDQFDTLIELIKELVRRQIGTKEWLILTKTIMEREKSLPEATDLNGFANSYQLIRQALERLDVFPNIRSHLALRACHVFLKTGNYTAAIEAANRAGEGVHQIEATYNAAQAYCHLNQFEQAIQSLDRCLELMIENPGYHEKQDAATEQKSADQQFNIDAAGQTLSDLKDVLAKIDKHPFLMAGTLLGYAREGKLLEHDKDVDVGIMGSEDQFEIFKTIQESGLFYISFKKINLEESHCIPIVHLKHGITIDIFIYYKKGNKFIKGLDNDFGYTQFFSFTPFSLKEIEFLGTKFYIPSPTDEYLAEHYGNWREPDLDYIPFLESPALMDVGGEVYQIIGRIKAIEAINENNPRKIAKVASLMEKVKNFPFGMTGKAIKELKNLKTNQQLNHNQDSIDL